MAVVDTEAVSNFEVYEPGTYRIKVDKWEPKKTKNGNNQLKISTTMDNGKAYTEFIVVTDASAWKIIAFMKAAGLKLPKMVDTESPYFTKLLHALPGRTLFVTLEKDEEYNNNKSTGFARDDQQSEDEIVDVDDAPEGVR
jgi:hypothetical protein